VNINNKTKLALIVSAIIGAQGCSSLSTANIDEERRAFNAEKQALEQREVQLQRAQAQLNAMKGQTVQTGAAVQGDDLLPPDAQAGECYARLWVEPVYETVSTSKLTKEASHTINIIPASYEWVEEQQLVSEASTRIETIDAVYGTETQRIKVADSSRDWFTGLARHDAPASSALVQRAKEHGIDVDNAQPNMCFHEHYIPAKYDTVQEQVLISQASSRIETTPARYEMVEKSVMVREAYSRLETIPAVYETVTEQILDKPAHKVWKKGTGPIQKINESTGEIMCLVDVPATYKIISKRVKVSDASTRKIEVPAQYKTIKVKSLVASASENVIDIPAKYSSVSKRQKSSDVEFVWHDVNDHTMSKASRTGNKICLQQTPERYQTVKQRTVITPASTRTVAVPAVYQTLEVKKLVKDASENRTEIAAVYKDVYSQKLIKDGYMEWRSILCDTNMTAGRIQDIQIALRDKGFNPGQIDGVIGYDTMNAVNAFQRKNELPVDKYLNIQTVEALGVTTR